VNVVAFLVCYLFGKDASGNFMLNDILGLHFFMASDFHVYQLITYMFMHGGFEHIIFNMFALWMFGCVVERVWGAKKFLFYYIACGVGAGLFQEAAQYVSYLYNDFVGGRQRACLNWNAAKMYQRDKIHFTREGYTLQGLLLHEAFIKAYNNYVATRLD
jgi:membrane associated rhomboid family serine protease